MRQSIVVRLRKAVILGLSMLGLFMIWMSFFSFPLDTMYSVKIVVMVAMIIQLLRLEEQWANSASPKWLCLRSPLYVKLSVIFVCAGITIATQNRLSCNPTQVTIEAFQVVFQIAFLYHRYARLALLISIV